MIKKIFMTVILSIAATGQITMASPTQLKSQGQLEIFKDDQVTCYVFQSSYKGGIDCHGLATESSSQIFSINLGVIERVDVDNRVCYVYSQSYKGGISCVEKTK